MEKMQITLFQKGRQGGKGKIVSWNHVHRELGRGSLSLKSGSRFKALSLQGCSSGVSDDTTESVF